MKRIVIIGGGITGLAAAHRLLELANETSQRLDLIILEASDRLGGVIQTEHHDEFILEHGPDSFLSEKPETVALARRLGIDSHLLQTNQEHRRSFIVNRGRLRPIPEGFNLMAPSRLWPFVISDIISWTGKVRMALDLLLPKGHMNDDESLAAFVRRRFGQEALERIAQPLIGGIYTADPEQLSLRATMPRFLEMERDDRSLIRSLQKRGRNEVKTAEAGGARYSLFLTFDRGMQFLVDRLAAEIGSASIQLNTRAVSLARDSESAGWLIQDGSGKSLRADGVCLALAAPAAASLLRDVDHHLAHELGGIPYASTATINLAYKRKDIPHPLDGFGFVVPFIEKRSLLACTFSSVKFADRAPKGSVLLRAFVGGALQPELFTIDEEEMTQRVLSDFRDLLGIRKTPLFSRIVKWKGSMPQYHVGHLDRVKRIEKLAAEVPNFALAGNAYTGAGISDCIREGERAADQIFRVSGDARG
ncbi:MAG: protoporphyrinogen oxidase [Pyrinomonadaceae bacterium]